MTSTKPAKPRFVSLRILACLLGLWAANPGFTDSHLTDLAESNSGFDDLLQPIPQWVKSRLPLPTIEANSWLLADFESGWIMTNSNVNARIEPASLVKLMTSYLSFEALTKQEINIDELVYVSEKAWKTGGSRMFLQVDSEVSVEELLKGLIIQSGNDAAVALAEHISGSVDEFVVRMNRKAEELGMLNTQFGNSSGLPHPQQYSTALDLTILVRHLIRNFPQYYSIYSEKEYTYNNISQRSRNTLLWKDSTIDGVKTGYTKNAGHCLIGSSRRGDMRLIATVIGAESEKARESQVKALLDYGYSAYQSEVVYRPGDEIHSARLWMGQEPTISVGVLRDVSIVYPKGNKRKLSGAIDLPASFEAPLAAGQQVGTIAIEYDDITIHTAGLYVNRAYPKGAWSSRLLDWIKRLFI